MKPLELQQLFDDNGWTKQFDFDNEYGHLTAYDKDGHRRVLCIDANNEASWVDLFKVSTK